MQWSTSLFYSHYIVQNILHTVRWFEIRYKLSNKSTHLCIHSSNNSWYSHYKCGSPRCAVSHPLILKVSPRHRCFRCNKCFTLLVSEAWQCSVTAYWRMCQIYPALYTPSISTMTSLCRVVVLAMMAGSGHACLGPIFDVIFPNPAQRKYQPSSPTNNETLKLTSFLESFWCGRC